MQRDEVLQKQGTHCRCTLTELLHCIHLSPISTSSTCNSVLTDFLSVWLGFALVSISLPASAGSARCCTPFLGLPSSAWRPHFHQRHSHNTWGRAGAERRGTETPQPGFGTAERAARSWRHSDHFVTQTQHQPGGSQRLPVAPQPRPVDGSPGISAASTSRAAHPHPSAPLAFWGHSSSAFHAFSEVILSQPNVPLLLSTTSPAAAGRPAVTEDARWRGGRALAGPGTARCRQRCGRRERDVRLCGCHLCSIRPDQTKVGNSNCVSNVPHTLSLAVTRISPIAIVMKL